MYRESGTDSRFFTAKNQTICIYIHNHSNLCGCDIDLLLSDLPPLVLEAVSSSAVDHADAVQGPYDQDGPRNADANGDQHPRHVSRLGGGAS